MSEVVLNEYADGKILAGTHAHVGRLVVNNPARHNAISLEMWDAAASVIAEMATDDAVRLLVISGAGGKAFASGADISKFESERATAEAVSHYQATSTHFYDTLENFPKPSIAAIRGYCIGGGLALAVCCDLRLCEERSRFGVPAARLGVGYGFSGIKRLTRLVSTSMAQEIFYTARQFSAQEAYDMGLVNRVLPDAMFDGFVDDYAQRICENAPLTIAAVKAVTLDIHRDPADRDLDRLDRMVQACFDSEDYVEGRRAFMEKRPPRFRGV